MNGSCISIVCIRNLYMCSTSEVLWLCNTTNCDPKYFFHYPWIASSFQDYEGWVCNAKYRLAMSNFWSHNSESAPKINLATASARHDVIKQIYFCCTYLVNQADLSLSKNSRDPDKVRIQRSLSNQIAIKERTLPSCLDRLFWSNKNRRI